MSIALISNTSAGAAFGGNTVTTSAINTTGANLLVVHLSAFHGAAGTNTISDSKGNTYTQLTQHGAGNSRSVFFYCLNPVVGTGHTFTNTASATFSSIAVSAWSGVATSSPVDGENGATGTGTSLSTGSVTPSEGNCLILAGLGFDTANTIAVNGTFTILDQTNAAASNHLGVAHAYVIQTALSAVNPQFSWSSSSQAATSIAVFKSDTGGGAATAYALDGPTNGIVGQESMEFTLTPDGDATGITVTLQDNASTPGTFSPSSIVFSGASPEVFTYTPAIDGTIEISTTNDGALDDPAPIEMVVLDLIPINDENLFFSPYNWFKNGGNYALTNNPGAYIKTKFTGTLLKMIVDVSALVDAGVSAGNYPRIVTVIDGVETYTQLSSSSEELTLATGLANTTHTAEIYFSGVRWDTNDRWNTPVMSIKILGFSLSTSAVLVAPDIYTKRAVIYGDSFTEGHEILAGGNTVAAQDASKAFGILLSNLLKTEVGLIGFASQGYSTAVPSSNLPDLEDSWDFYFNASSRLSSGLFSPEPDYIICAMGTNDSSGVQTALTNLLVEWRTAAPNAKIFIMLPPGLAQESAITAAVSASSDPNVYLIDHNRNLLTGSRFKSGSHLSVWGHAFYATLDGTLMRDEDSGSGGGASSSFYISIF